MIRVRPAVPGDIPPLIALDPIARGESSRQDSISRWVRAGACHVALRDNQIVGYAAFTEGFFGQPFIELMMVAESARRAGIGAALVSHCIALAADAPKLWTSTNRSNAPMRSLLGRCGFVPSGQIDNLDEGDPELIFLRRND